MKRPLSDTLVSSVRSIIPRLTKDLHKGSCGRIAVVGGSFEYTGAPYFAGISALKTGADLCYLFCTRSAAIPIKSYSPELIVHPVLPVSDEVILEDVDSSTEGLVCKALEEVKRWLPRMHCVILGPGLGSDSLVLQTAKRIIEMARVQSIPVVIDGNAIDIVCDHPEVIAGYSKAIVTPNVREYERLQRSIVTDKDDWNAPKSQRALMERLDNVTIVLKGHSDVICSYQHQAHHSPSRGVKFYESMEIVVDKRGGTRRCSGQGDVLAGTIGTFLSWSHGDHVKIVGDVPASMIAAYGGCMLTRACSLSAYEAHGRSVTTTNLIAEIGRTFDGLFQDERVFL